MKQVYIPELQVYSLYHGGRYLSREITAQEMAFLLLLLFPLESYPTNVTTPSDEIYCFKKRWCFSTDICEQPSALISLWLFVLLI